MKNTFALAKLVISAAVLSCAGLATATANTNYPEKKIRLVVPFAAGGGVDALARPLAKEMTETLGQSVYVENKASATGQVGAIEVAKSDPDGYTVLISSAAFGTTPIFYPSVPYDPIKDFKIVSVLAASPQILVTRKKFSRKDGQGIDRDGSTGREDQLRIDWRIGHAGTCRGIAPGSGWDRVFESSLQRCRCSAT